MQKLHNFIAHVHSYIQLLLNTDHNCTAISQTTRNRTHHFVYTHPYHNLPLIRPAATRTTLITPLSPLMFVILACSLTPSLLSPFVSNSHFIHACHTIHLASSAFYNHPLAISTTDIFTHLSHLFCRHNPCTRSHGIYCYGPLRSLTTHLPHWLARNTSNTLAPFARSHYIYHTSLQFNCSCHFNNFICRPNAVNTCPPVSRAICTSTAAQPDLVACNRIPARFLPAHIPISAP
jgi:hypothetical protein